MTTVSSNPRGFLLGSYIKSLAVARGDLMGAAAYASGQGARYAQVAMALKAAVAPLDTVNDPGGYQVSSSNFPIAQDFVESLRPATILGRLQGLVPQPFNLRMVSTASGASAAFRGEGAPIPVTTIDLDTAVMKFGWIGSICVVTQELVRSSRPNVELILAAELIKAVAQVLDVAFLDPESTAVTGRPASITSGVTPIVSGGNTAALIDADLKAAVAAVGDNDLSTAYWCMRPSTALHLASLRGTGGSYAYPTVNARGGQLLGLPVLVSNNITDSNSPAEAYIALIVAGAVNIADDGAAMVDFSESAALQMDDAPSAGTANVVSLWEHNLVGIRGNRAVCWAPRNAKAAAVITSVQF